jgi:uncharacterized protein DUF5655
MTLDNSHTIDQHFEGRSPHVWEIYERILAVARDLGPVGEEPKKTSIHLTNRTAFAGIATRRESLILTLKAESDIQSPRIARREQASAHRWHLEVKLSDPAQVDSELKEWLRQAYLLAG